MTRIFASLLSIFTMVVLVAGATYAVFKDTDTIPGHSISTAQNNIHIDAEGVALGNVAAKPVDQDGLQPGEFSDWFRGAIHNRPDSSNVRLFMHVNNVQGDACGNARIVVRTGHAGTNQGERQFLVYSGALSGLEGESNKQEITGHVFTAPDYLPPNNTAVIQQRARILNEIGTCTWDEVFTAESV